jgi:phage terminase Nu1 subunit (DNA packaging protein)
MKTVRMIDIDKIISVVEASEILKVSKNRVQAMAREGCYWHKRVGGKQVMIFDEDEIREFAKKERKVGPNPKN